MDGGEGGFGGLTGGIFYEGNKSKILTQGALPLSAIPKLRSRSSEGAITTIFKFNSRDYE